MINWIKKWRASRLRKKNLKIYNEAVEQLTLNLQIKNPRLSKRAAEKEARKMISKKLMQNPPPKTRGKLRAV